jgi:hypothetical protein
VPQAPAKTPPPQRQFPNQHRYALVDPGANSTGVSPPPSRTESPSCARSTYGEYTLACAASGRARHGRAWGITAGAAITCSWQGPDDVCRDGYSGRQARGKGVCDHVIWNPLFSPPVDVLVLILLRWVDFRFVTSTDTFFFLSSVTR